MEDDSPNIILARLKNIFLDLKTMSELGGYYPPNTRRMDPLDVVRGL